jgi:D-methionine transport system permease protein
LILIFLLVPLTRFIVGTSIGPSAIIVPLVIAAFPFVARLVESSLREVDKGVVEAAQSMGAGYMQIIVKVLLREAKPSLLVQAAIATTTILGYSAMAGIVGAGGLGAVAITHGYYRGNREIMYIMVAVLVVVVQVIQAVGMWIAKKSNKRINAK